MPDEIQVFEGDGVESRVSDWNRVNELLRKIEGTRFKDGWSGSAAGVLNKVLTDAMIALNKDRSARFSTEVIYAVEEVDKYLQGNADKLFADDRNQTKFKVQTWGHQAWQIAVEHDKRIGIG